MPYRKTIVCLANSDKPGGSCVAGRELLANGAPGPWVRPITSRPGGTLAYIDCLYANHSSPKPLDLIDIAFLTPRPTQPQAENHLIAPGQWINQGTFPWSGLVSLTDQPPTLWPIDGSTSQGVNNCVTPLVASTLTASLLLIHVDQMRLETLKNSYNDATAWYGQFYYRSLSYRFSVTDPVVRAVYPQIGTRATIPDAFLCLSLTEPFRDGRCHKLIAAVLTRNR